MEVMELGTHGRRHRPGRGRDRHLAARAAQGLRHPRRAGRAVLVRAAHPRLRRRRSSSTESVRLGHARRRATRPSSATRRSARATTSSPASWTPSAFLPEGVPAHWSVYFGVDDTDAASAKIVELGGSIVQAGQDTPYGRLADGGRPHRRLFKLVQDNSDPPPGLHRSAQSSARTETWWSR